MATATTTVTVNAFPTGVDQTGRFGVLYGTIAIGSGGTYVTNGLPVAWKVADNIYSGNSGNPFRAHMDGTAGFVYKYDATHNTIRIFQTGSAVSTALAELANAASVTADTLDFDAYFQRVD